MVTLNADHHPLLNRMHRPDPARATTVQDKRAVPLYPSAFTAWLCGSLDEATAALALPHIDDYDAGPDQTSLLVGGSEKQRPDDLALL